MKYKVGDKCRIINLDKSGGSSRYIGYIAQIINVHDKCYSAHIINNNGTSVDTYTLRESEVQEINKINFKLI